MMELPQDPAMLLSVINMKLRDESLSLDELCQELGINSETLCEKLKMAGYEYSQQYNRFW